MAYSVSQRTREIGIRMALGATVHSILFQVAGQGVVWTCLGVVPGLVVSLAVGRVLPAVLYDTSPTDALTLIGAAPVLAATALVACYFPARRAMKVDPAVALRFE